MIMWHIITCEYPPQVGGVSDYTQLLTQHLREAGDEVHIWAPSCTATEEPHVHRVLGDFSRADLRGAGELVDQYPKPRTLLVQWVPHGYGKRGINLAFAGWIASRARRGDRIFLMMHEPFLEAAQLRWKHRFVSLMQRRMVRRVLRAAERVFISIPAWEDRVRELAPPLLEFEWLPIPATVSVAADMKFVASIRSRFGANPLVIGHLGTYSAELRHLLEPAVLKTLEDVPEAHLLLLGSHSEQYAAELHVKRPDFSKRIRGTGLLPDTELASYIAGCDLALQPYPDGLSSRRTSLMNLISRGTPVVSNIGHLTEQFWIDSNAVALSPTSEHTQLAAVCISLLRDDERRRYFGNAGRDLYMSRFDWPYVVTKLRSAAECAHPAAAGARDGTLE